MHMSFRSARLALFLSTAFVTVVVAPSAVQAAKPSKAAKKLAKAAKKLLKKKDFDGAIAKFEEAYTESPAAVFQLGIAKALQKKGDNAKALEVLTKVAGGDDKKGAKKAKKAKKKLIKKLTKTHSEVAVESAPDGAAFTLTGKDTEITGETPWVGWLAHGKYKVEFTADGYEAKVDYVRAEKKASPTLKVELEKARAD